MPKDSLQLLADLAAAKDFGARAQTLPVKHGDNAFGVGPVMDYLDGIIRAPFEGRPVLQVLDQHLKSLLPSGKPAAAQAPKPATTEDAAEALSPEERAVLEKMGVIPYPTEVNAPVTPVERSSTFRDMHPLEALRALGEYDPTLHEHLQSTLDQYNSERNDGGFDTPQDVLALPATPMAPE